MKQPSVPPRMDSETICTSEKSQALGTSQSEKVRTLLKKAQSIALGIPREKGWQARPKIKPVIELLSLIARTWSAAGFSNLARETCRESLDLIQKDDEWERHCEMGNLLGIVGVTQAQIGDLEGAREIAALASSRVQGSVHREWAPDVRLNLESYSDVANWIAEARCLAVIAAEQARSGDREAAETDYIRALGSASALRCYRDVKVEAMLEIAESAAKSGFPERAQEAFLQSEI